MAVPHATPVSCSVRCIPSSEKTPAGEFLTVPRIGTDASLFVSTGLVISLTILDR